MQKNSRIGRHIVLAFLIFGISLILILGLSLVIALKSSEMHILDVLRHTELKHIQKQGEATRLAGLFYSIYITPLNELSSLPEHVRDLPQGTHEVMYDNQNYRVLVEHIGDMCFTVQINETNIQKREQDFVRVIWSCLIVTLIIALVIGWKLAHKVIQPITLLSNQITTLSKYPKRFLDISEFSDDEIGDLAKVLNHYHHQLQNLLIREKEFACNVSHELRTPVTSISLAAEVLAGRPNLSAKEQEQILRIQRGADEMSELIETFLVLAQIIDESTQYQYSCEMEPIVRKVIEQQRVWLGNKPIEIKFEENGHLKVSAPPGVLSVLVANLVRNAFRFTKRGTVLISLTSDQLTVMDTGIGIDVFAQAQIFKESVKDNLGDADRIKLGLAIVQRICERYDWTISFESTKDQGSRFTVLFNSI